MNQRPRLVFLLFALVTLLPFEAGALGLGGISVASILHQPLDATVAVTDLGNTVPGDLKVSLASAEAFERQGVERAHQLHALRFEVAPGDNGATLHITSRQPMTEPFVDFIVEVLWPEGRLLKRFTVLLNPPGV